MERRLKIVKGAHGEEKIRKSYREIKALLVGFGQLQAEENERKTTQQLNQEAT
ncbi:hypothetical protein SESBI_20537 [Sesbania bispinosa]|nr:hypothetical protein SESBI_20537 [Sesbania bispinosa]